MITILYRRQCGRCLGPISVREIDEGRKSIAICPKCSNRPDLADMIAALPTPAFLEHIEKCRQCKRAGTVAPCAEGIEALAQYPGKWSESEVAGQ